MAETTPEDQEVLGYHGKRRANPDIPGHLCLQLEKLIGKGRRVGVYPINEGSWVDIGNWDEYLKFVNKDK